MKATIDAAGRLVIPKAIRQLAGLTPGLLVEVRYRGGYIELAPLPMAVQMMRKGRLIVAVPKSDVPPLAANVIEETREALERERSESDPQ
ncbi:MAG: AbrB/MazE/SpoVT family DNA-binding domain-containing protein [Gammaproteobacteria bacterium]